MMLEEDEVEMESIIDLFLYSDKEIRFRFRHLGHFQNTRLILLKEYHKFLYYYKDQDPPVTMYSRKTFDKFCKGNFGFKAPYDSEYYDESLSPPKKEVMLIDFNTSPTSTKSDTVFKLHPDLDWCNDQIGKKEANTPTTAEE